MSDTANPPQSPRDTGRSTWRDSLRPPAPPPLSVVPPRPAPEAEPVPTPTVEPALQDEAGEGTWAYAQPDPQPLIEATLASPVGWERKQASALLGALAELRVDLALLGIRHTDDGSLAVLRTGPARPQVLNLMPTALTSIGWPADLAVSAVGPDAIELVLPVPVAGRANQSASWVPVAVRDAVYQAADETGESYTGFFLGAFNRQYPKLATLFPNRALAPGPMPTQTTRRRRGLGTSVQLYLNLDADQRAVLDAAQRTSGAGSRSELVTRILEEDLGLRPPTA
jgi:hypothetical protein